MEKKNELRKYLVSRFLITLILVGILQMIINFVLKQFILPEIDDLLNLDGMLVGGSARDAIRVFVTCLLTIILRAAMGSGSLMEKLYDNSLIGYFIPENIKKSLIAINEGLDDTKLAVYAVMVVVLFFAMVVIWALPYVIGAISYSKRVSLKVKEIEAARVAREQEYEKQRNLLLSDITHDIKTPITTIAGFSQALSDGTVKQEDQKTYLDAIYNKSMKVSELIALLFEYIKLDSTGYTLNCTELDLAELTRECVAGVYAEFEEKNMPVELNVPESKITVYADKMQLERAINNILSNTIKHNPDNTPVFITLKKENGEAVLSISDKGTRIDKEDAIHLFEPFYLADKSRKSGSGNGLGLSISKKIMDMHGGRICLIQYRDVEKNGMVKTFKLCIKAKQM